MNAILNHAQVRLRTALRDPFSLALLLFSALVTVIFWPGLTDASGAGWPGGQLVAAGRSVVSVSIALIWLVMWPAIATSPLRGQAVKGARSTTYAAHALPALPIGPRQRIVAEALTTLAVVLLVRAAGAGLDLLGEVERAVIGGPADTGAWRQWYLVQTVAGAFVMLPFLLLSSRSSMSIEAYWLRSAALAAAVFGAMKFGWLETLGPCIAIGLLLSGAVLMLPDRLASGLTLPRLARAGNLSRRRPFRSAERQFRRDLWLRPLPVAAGLLSAQVVFIILDRTVALPELAFYFLSVITCSWLLAFVPLQPMRSRMAMAGIFCKPGFRPGDFAEACGVLPVRRTVVVRSVFLYGLVTTLGVCLVVVGLICLSAWFDFGTFALIDSDGDPLWPLVTPIPAFVPTVAALLTCAILGDRKGALIAGGLLLLLPQIGVLMLIIKPAVIPAAALALLLTVVAPIPALRHLRA